MAVDPRVGGKSGGFVIFMGSFGFSDLNEVQFLLAQLLCQQTYISLIV